MTEQDEFRAIVDLRHELVRRFPRIPAQRIETTIDQSWWQFRGAPIRNFVPVLVRRQVTAHLSRPAVPLVAN